MDTLAPKLLLAKVMHKRLSPAPNSFAYGVYYLSLPITADQHHAITELAINRFGLTSFFDKDHGAKDGSGLYGWAQERLAEWGITGVRDIQLIAMPRILGYVFNPVSFWVCYNAEGGVAAVLCAVNNTFGENHTYLCAHEDGRPIGAEESLRAEKVFHVSPFLEVKGHYTFRFQILPDRCMININYDDAVTGKVLLTAINGHFTPLTKQSLRRAFWRYPLLTCKAIFLIHFQAVKLLKKRVRFFTKPVQRAQKTTRTTDDAR